MRKHLSTVIADSAFEICVELESESTALLVLDDQIDTARTAAGREDRLDGYRERGHAALERNS